VIRRGCQASPFRSSLFPPYSATGSCCWPYWSRRRARSEVIGDLVCGEFSAVRAIAGVGRTASLPHDSFFCRISDEIVDLNQRRPPVHAQLEFTIQDCSSEDELMDKDRVIGSAKQIKGTVKQVAGKAVGDSKLEAEGNADKIEGQVQNAIGGVKDTLKGK
jgi:uncharacterized protein YjbJ (UPF0337 family)